MTIYTINQDGGHYDDLADLNDAIGLAEELLGGMQPGTPRVITSWTSCMAKLIHLAAVARNRVIGNNNELCWHLPEDLRRFKQVTMGYSVLMGRKTWESLPVGLRPLPGRRNIVVTRQQGFAAPGAEVVSSIEAAQALVSAEDTAFIIGGAELYRTTLANAEALMLTEVGLEPEGDTWYPELGNDWVEHSREAHVSNQGVPYAFVVHRRR